MADAPDCEDVGRYLSLLWELRGPGEKAPTIAELSHGYLALVEQLPMREIAERQSLSLSSVEAHLRELALRLGCSNVRELRRRFARLLWDRVA